MFFRAESARDHADGGKGLGGEIPFETRSGRPNVLYLLASRRASLSTLVVPSVHEKVGAGQQVDLTL